MKPIMKKWLTGLLCASLLAGSAPAYGADFSAEADFSSEISVEETQEEDQTEPETPSEPEAPAEVDLEQPDDFSSQDSPDPAETLDPDAPSDDFSSDDLISDDSEAPEVQITDETEDQKEYLTDLNVYTGNGVKDALKLDRREDMDEEFGGRVYTVEYGSNYNSSALWISADLAKDAPEGSTVTLSAWNLSGTQETKEMSATAYTDGQRYSFSDIFASGNGKRAIYTIKAGTESDSVTYKLVVLRRLDLSSIRCYLPTDTDMAKNLITDFDTSGVTRDYEVSVTGTDKVKIKAVPFGENWYGLTINGKSISSGDPIEIPLTGDSTEIAFEMKEDGTYADPDCQGKTYTSTGSYKVIVQKQLSDSVKFQVTPQNAVISVYDKNGERMEPSQDSASTFASLIKGQEYTWNVSCYGYISQRNTFKAGEQAEITVELKKQDATQPEITDNDWINFRNSESNNGITGTSTPTDASSTVQKWAMRIGVGQEASVTPPLILGGYLYVASGQFIYKLDKNTGDIVATSEPLNGNMIYALNSLTYAEGMLFAQIGGGQIQAVSASTLRSVWISESLGGQTLSPITYKDGYIYTGTWNSETTAGSYFCLSVTDEDPSKGDETKYCTWKYNHKGGFYWAGSYASGDYLVFGSDDGSGEKNYTSTAILYSVNTHTGLLLDKLTGLNGDIRSTVVYNNGYVYFTTKGGYLYRVAMNADGTFGRADSYNLGGMATAAPVVYKGRIYVGVCGQESHRFDADAGHHFDVLNESAAGLSLAYEVSIPGYPQAAPLLSTAYENQDFNGDGQADGRVYLYFTYNARPGGLYLLADEPGQTTGKAEELFRPESDKQQYCISTICADRDGTLYYKNDSNYLMAVETNGAYLDSVTAQADNGKVTWDKAFQRSVTEYTIRTAENVSKVTLNFKTPAGCTLTVNGKTAGNTYTADVSSGSAEVTVVAALAGKSRTYTLHLTKDQGNTNLANLTASISYTYSDSTKWLALTPAFSADKTSYRVTYLGSSFLRIYAEPADPSADVTIEAGKCISKVIYKGKVTGSGSAVRLDAYFDSDASIEEAQVKIVVTAKTGKKTEYTLTIQRKETISTPTPTPTVTPTPTATPKPTPVPEKFGAWKTVSKATVFAPEKQQRKGTKGTVQTRTVGRKLTPTIRLNTTNIKLRVKQTTALVKVSGLARGDSIRSWTSSNRNIATVDSRGRITGKRAGRTRITVTLRSGKKAYINVTVQKSIVRTEKITGLRSSQTMKRGAKLTLKPVLTPLTSQEKITYSSSNKNVAVVSSRGVINARKKGTARITVRSGKKSYVIKVTVK